MGGLARVRMGALTAVMTAALVQTGDGVRQHTEGEYTIACTRRVSGDWVARLFVTFAWEPELVASGEGRTEDEARDNLTRALLELVRSARRAA